MEFLLSHTNGGIRPDHVKGCFRWNLVGSCTADSGRSAVRSIPSGNIERALVHINTPDCRIGGFEGHGYRQWTPATSQVEKHAGLREWGSIFEQDCCSRVEMAGTERATGTLEHNLMPSQRERMRGGPEGRLGVL